MIVLTGPPRLAGVDRHYPSVTGWMECFWDEGKTIWHDYDGGALVEWRRRVQLVGSCTYESASQQAALALASDLRGVFDVVPRTRADGDPEWADEITVPCRRTSRLPATRPILRKRADGTPVWRIEVEFESCIVYGDVPGLPEGGFYLVGETDETGTLEPYGDATIATGADVALVFTAYDGTVETATGETWRLGSEAVAAMRVEDAGDVPGIGPAYRIHTTAPPEGA